MDNKITVEVKWTNFHDSVILSITGNLVKLQCVYDRDIITIDYTLQKDRIRNKRSGEDDELKIATDYFNKMVIIHKKLIDNSIKVEHIYNNIVKSLIDEILKTGKSKYFKLLMILCDYAIERINNELLDTIKNVLNSDHIKNLEESTIIYIFYRLISQTNLLEKSYQIWINIFSRFNVYFLNVIYFYSSPDGRVCGRYPAISGKGCVDYKESWVLHNILNAKTVPKELRHLLKISLMPLSYLKERIEIGSIDLNIFKLLGENTLTKLRFFLNNYEKFTPKYDAPTLKHNLFCLDNFKEISNYVKDNVESELFFGLND